MNISRHIIAACTAIVAVGGIFFFVHEFAQAPASVFDPRNASFTIEGATVALHDGKAEVPAAPGSASKVITTYFGNEAYGDLSGDRKDDVAFLITQTRGGSGTFYYVVVAYTSPSGYTTSNAFLVGDRIAPQTTEIRSGELYVNFAERTAGEPMSARPSQGATLALKLTPEGVLTGLMQ